MENVVKTSAKFATSNSKIILKELKLMGHFKSASQPTITMYSMCMLQALTCLYKTYQHCLVILKFCFQKISEQTL